MLEEFFKFPIVMIDGDNEERKVKDKQRFGDLPQAGEESEEYDMVFGEAEYPYWDFIGIEDRWLPSKESLQKALDNRFEACIVRFANVGQLLVPWTKKKFKAEILKFGEAYEAAQPAKEPKTAQLKVLTLTPEQFKKATDDGKQE
jgi:hypothetical protein